MNEYQDNEIIIEKRRNNNNLIKSIMYLFGIIIVAIVYILLPTYDSNKAEKNYIKLVDKLCGSAIKYTELRKLEKTEQGDTIYVKIEDMQKEYLVDSKDVIDPRKTNDEAEIPGSSYIRLSKISNGSMYCEGLINTLDDEKSPILSLKGSKELIIAKGTNFVDPGAKATDDIDGDISSRVERSGNVDINKPGEYEITYSSLDMAGNLSSIKRTIKVKEYNDLKETTAKRIDTIEPKIEIKGKNPYCLELGYNYKEPGVTAKDNVDGNITKKVVVENKINNKISKSYRVTYTVTDTAGNKAIAYRSVMVKENCNPPKQEVINEEEANYEDKYEEIIDEEETNYEDEYEEIIDEEETNYEDEYEETIDEEETTEINSKPSISLLGDSAITIMVGESYSDIGATAYDLEDGDLTHEIIIDSSQLNEYKVGIYIVSYEVTDSSGLTGKTSRIVNVINQGVSANVATFNKTPQNLKIKLGYVQTIEKLTAMDSNNNVLNVETNIFDSTGKEVQEIDFYNSGQYIIMYTAKPNNGVSQTVKRIVEIYDDEAPVLIVPDQIVFDLRTSNCDITETLLIEKGLLTNDGNNKISPKIVIENFENKLCTVNETGFEIKVGSVDDSNNKSEIKNIKIIVESAEVVKPQNIDVTSIGMINCINGELKLDTGSTMQLNTVVYPLDATDKTIKWTSSDSNIVSVSNEIIKTATFSGKATITAESINGKKATCNIQVETPPTVAINIPVSQVEIGGCESGSITLQKGMSKILSAKVKPENASNKKVNWSSNNSNIKITTNGEVKGINIGESIITLKSEEGNKVSTCKIIVNNIPIVVDTTSPLKVTVKTNNINPQDPYNKNGIWSGGTEKKEIRLLVESIETESKISKFLLINSKGIVLKEYYPLISNNNTTEIIWDKDINEYVTIKAVNTERLQSEQSNPILFKLDNTGPTIVFNNWIENPNTWVKDKEIKVTYEAKDNLSEILKYEYTHDDVKAKQLSDIKIAGTTNQVEVTFKESNLNKFVYVRAIDKLGNIGPWTQKPSYLNMDSIPPMAPSISLLNNNTSKVTVGFKFTDGVSPKISGFGKFEYKLNNNPIKEILVENEGFDITTEGTYRVDAWSYDKAGNKSNPAYKDNIKVLKGEINASSIKLNSETIFIKTKETKNLVATILPSEASNKKVTWTSSDKSIATVTNTGEVKGISTGIATITAETENGLKATSEISVDLTKQQIIDIESGKLKLTYDLFGAVGNGITDDSNEIRAAHDYANKLYAEKDKLVTVYGTEGKKYKIGALTKPILVITDVDWRNATLIFDDSKLTEEQLKIDVFKISTLLYYKTGKESYGKEVDSSVVLNKNTTTFPKAIELINNLSTKTDIKSINTYAEFKKSNNYYVEVENTFKNQFNRYGNYGEQQPKPQYDSFKIDLSGKILNDIIWNFDKVSSLKIYPIYKNQLSIKNAKIISIVYNNGGAETYYIKRSILVNRSNTLVEKINHILQGETDKGNKYSGLLRLALVSDIVVNKSAFSPHKGHGTYDINVAKAINITFNNCTDNKEIDDTSTWGVWGGNYQKDVVVNSSRFNRIDAHAGIWNLTVNNSTIGNKGITVVGGGLLKVTNTKFVKSINGMIYLRQDYGSTWNGTIELNKVTFTPASSRAYLIKGSKANWDFGYDTYFPKVIINDLTINGTSDVYAFGYSQASIDKPYIFLGDMSLTNIKSDNVIGIFDGDFTNKYLNKSSHKSQTLINISLKDVKLKQKTDITNCKTLGPSCKFKYITNESQTLNTNVNISLNPITKSKKVPTDFLGFSTEKTSLCEYVTTYKNNTVLQNLYKNLSPSVWRIGGNTVETVNWDKTSNECNDSTVNSKLVDDVFSFANKVNWKVIYDLNLKNNTLSKIKDESKYVLSKYNSLLHSFEIGNEPDIYKDWDYSTYQNKWTQYANGLKSLPYDFNIIGPSSTNAIPTDNRNPKRLEFFEEFIKNSKDLVSFTSFHLYPISNRQFSQNNYDNLKILIDKNKFEETKQIVNSYAQISRKYSLPLRLAETNLGGDVGVSDSYASSLWTIDYLFTVLDSGIKGVNFHGYHLSKRNHYSPIWSTPDKIPFATPEYYGLLLFKQAASNGYLIPLNIDTSLNVSAYAIENNNKKLQLVIINKETVKDAVVKVNTNTSYKSASAVRLTAPSLSTKITSPTNSQVKLGGNSVNADGSWSPNYEDISVKNNYSTINIPPISAILVTFEP